MNFKKGDIIVYVKWNGVCAVIKIVDKSLVRCLWSRKDVKAQGWNENQEYGHIGDLEAYNSKTGFSVGDRVLRLKAVRKPTKKELLWIVALGL